MSIRRATHAGSWYNSSKRQLDEDLTGWLKSVHKSPPAGAGPARAIISPHAGLVYCGGTMAHGFTSLNPATTNRIFVLGPSHKTYLTGCAISKCKKFETPFYNIPGDAQTVSELHQSGMFGDFEVSDDENEHSLEMQFPMIAKVMADYKDNYTLIPIVVGNVTLEHAREYAKVFEPFLADPRTVFVVSSDFCHWGNRFSYCYGAEDDLPIWQTVTNLDKRGMDAIETLKAAKFESYLSETHNTICGRRPIIVLMATVELYQKNHPTSTCELNFLDYSQSSKCVKKSQSSVSYASATLTIS